MDGNTKRKSRARVIVLAVFAIGFAAGALSMNLYQRMTSAKSDLDERPRPQEIILRKMDQRLRLTRQQEDSIKSILDDTFNQYAEERKKLEPYFKQAEPRFNEIRQKSRDRMRAELTDDQLPKFEELLKEEDKRREERRQSQK
ncbi:MAG TPA: hypothetical protein VKM94_03965 [Blastocatellia bacterium]|nr:hypothetical protein [Blastocatellia bacterium]